MSPVSTQTDMSNATSMSGIHLLLVEDNPSDSLLLQGTLNSQYPGQYATTVAETLREAKLLLRQQVFEAVLLDLSLPDSEGLETIGELAAAAPDAPIVVLTGMADKKIVPEAVRCGAQDYLFKGQSDGATIARTIHYAIDRKRTEEELRKQRGNWRRRTRNCKRPKDAWKRTVIATSISTISHPSVTSLLMRRLTFKRST